jgi:hypothetical protein
VTKGCFDTVSNFNPLPLYKNITEKEIEFNLFQEVFDKRREFVHNQIAKPSQAKPSQAKPSQAKPSQAKPSQAKPITPIHY